MNIVEGTSQLGLGDNTNLPVSPQRATRPPNNFNQKCLERLKLDLALHRFFTFTPTFEQETRLKREDLANSGLYLSECKKLLVCYFCTGEIPLAQVKSWRTSESEFSGEDIDTKHQELRPDCPLFNQLTENVTWVPSNCNNYKFEAYRLYSLSVIPWIAPVSIYDLAHFGFYYANSVDNVRCVFCKLEVRGWEPTDTAEDEHRRWNPNCPFLTLRDVGNIPIGDELLASSRNSAYDSLRNPFSGNSLLNCKLI